QRLTGAGAQVGVGVVRERRAERNGAVGAHEHLVVSRAVEVEGARAQADGGRAVVHAGEGERDDAGAGRVQVQARVVGDRGVAVAGGVRPGVHAEGEGY